MLQSDYSILRKEILRARKRFNHHLLIIKPGNMVQKCAQTTISLKHHKALGQAVAR